MLQTEEKTQCTELVKKTGLKHIAIIMDGNRRWAKEHFLPSALGHKKGVEALKNIVSASHTFGIKYLTLYAFSTENWGRPQDEVDFLMNLLEYTIENELTELHKNKVKLRFIGDLSALNQNLQDVLKKAETTTANNTGVNLQIAINYGSRNEITNAIKNIMSSGIEAKDITEEVISKNLYTHDIPDPDLLIRTGGEVRISNYLLWQIAYSEIYITKKYWPEFDEDELGEAIFEFARRQRRWGA